MHKQQKIKTFIYVQSNQLSFLVGYSLSLFLKLLFLTSSRVMIVLNLQIEDNLLCCRSSRQKKKQQLLVNMAYAMYCIVLNCIVYCIVFYFHHHHHYGFCLLVLLLLWIFVSVISLPLSLSSVYGSFPYGWLLMMMCLMAAAVEALVGCWLVMVVVDCQQQLCQQHKKLN